MIWHLEQISILRLVSMGTTTRARGSCYRSDTREVGDAARSQREWVVSPRSRPHWSTHGREVGERGRCARWAGARTRAWGESELARSDWSTWPRVLAVATSLFDHLESKKFKKMQKFTNFIPNPCINTPTVVELITYTILSHFLFQTPLSSHNVGLVSSFELLHGCLAVR